VRVGHGGRPQWTQGRLDGAGLVATLLGIVLASVLTLAVVSPRFAIALRLLGERPTARRGRRTHPLTAQTLLLVGATFLFFVDRRRSNHFAGSLRGMSTRAFRYFLAAIGYWMIGFPLPRLRHRFFNALAPSGLDP